MERICDQTTSVNADLKEFAGVLRLSDKEYRIFCDIGKGMGPRELGKRHAISLETISKYYERMYDKLNIQGGFRELIRLAVRYDYAGLKRVAVMPPPPAYKFVQASEEAPIQALPAQRNGHSLLASGRTQMK